MEQQFAPPSGPCHGFTTNLALVALKSYVQKLYIQNILKFQLDFDFQLNLINGNEARVDCKLLWI